MRTTTGASIRGGTPEQFGSCIRSESARFGKVLEQAGIGAQR